MQQIIDAVVQKTGLPADKAQAAVEAVIGHLKSRLPGPIAGEIEKLVTGGGSGGQAGGLGSVAGKLGL